MRYAVYFTPPPGTPLAVEGAAFLGRDAFSGATVPAPVIPGIEPSRVAEITADPRRYGFHGTLKPPFALAEGRSEDELRDAFRRFAASRVPFETRLVVGRLSGFLALVPADAEPRLRALADGAVMTLDPFRRPPGEAELARRRRSGLSPAQEANLLAWGYPYVQDEFRFHMTLSGRLDEPELGLVEKAARAALDAHLSRPVRFDSLGLFVEPEPGAPFLVLETASFAREPA